MQKGRQGTGHSSRCLTEDDTCRARSWVPCRPGLAGPSRAAHLSREPTVAAGFGRGSLPYARTQDGQVVCFGALSLKTQELPFLMHPSHDGQICTDF